MYQYLSRILLLLFCFIQYEAVKSQDVGDLGYGGYNNHFQLWNSVKINKDFKYGISASLQYLLRTDLTERVIDGHYFYANLKYKPLKYLHLDFRFRGVTTPEKNLYRFEFGIKPRYKHKDWTFGFRTAYFNEREYFAQVYQRGRYPTHYWRNRIEFQWNFKRSWSAFLSGELYTRFDNRGMYARRFAAICGIEYAFDKISSINVSYMGQPDISKKVPNFVQAISIVYTFDIPKKFKKKKKKKKKHSVKITTE